MVKSIYRDRISTLIEIWGYITQNYESLDREKLVGILRENYEKKGLKPFRGFKVDNLYEKELISLYVIGKDGLNLYNEYKDLFQKLFKNEINYEYSLELINQDPIVAYKFLGEDKEGLARALRLVFTRVIFEFVPEESLFEKLRRLYNVEVDSIKHTAISFARFYSAFKIAEGIAEGKITNKTVLDATRKALAISIGIKYPLPKDSYIQLIAKEVFNVSDNLIKRSFSNFKIIKKR
ncbi:MAG: DUF2192 domain-containing protein [Sulfolobaceae archaeon]